MIESGMERTLSRDVDGSLLFCVRGAGSSGQFATKKPNAIRVWRSTDDARTWKLDHPTSATLQLGDGKWHHVLIYRGKEDPTSRNPISQAGCYLEEVTSSGPPLPLWKLPNKSPSPGQ